MNSVICFLIQEYRNNTTHINSTRNIYRRVAILTLSYKRPNELNRLSHKASKVMFTRLKRITLGVSYKTTQKS